MKKKLLLITGLLLNIYAFAQTDGINYQAVIIDNNPQEIPGVDIPNNNVPNKPLEVRFTIEDGAGIVVYQETHQTETDPFGMISLMIGQGVTTSGSPSEFNQIYWDNPKRLIVEIDLFDGNGLITFSQQNLTYIPYVRHREIIATSTLDVDGETNLNNSLSVNNQSPTNLSGTLTVDGETNIESDFNVNNQSTTTLSGDLYVFGTAFFTDGVFDNLTVNQHSSLNTLTADGITNINNAFNVNNANLSNLSGNLNVDGRTDLNDDLKVEGVSLFNNRVRINAEVNATQNSYNSYPFQVQGSSQGIAIRLTEDQPDRDNNYITFFSNNGQARGRIEGNDYLEPIALDFLLDIIDPPSVGDLIDLFIDFTPAPEFNFDPDALINDVFENQFYANDFSFTAYHYTMDFAVSIQRFGVNLAAATGLCATGDCDDAIWAFVDLSIDGIQLAEWYLYNAINIGIAFESGSADYAEWLKKYDENEPLFFGDVVGVRGGLISKSFASAENYMVVSQNPLISGAMPAKEDEHLFERIAFMGQVPVKVIGKVNKGDYVLPSGNADGLAMAVSPELMKIDDYKRIIGVAWDTSSGDSLFSYVNTAVGINSNDMSASVKQMQQTINLMQLSLAKLDPDFKVDLYDLDEKMPTNSDKINIVNIKDQLVDPSKNQQEQLRQLSQKIKAQFETSEFDFSKFPYLMEAIENPTPENGQKLAEHYAKVIKRMRDMSLKRK
ncbi:DUF4795 domain-containing protein [Psychroserpens sp. SPM9]|uniref:DUF4795 domain-containing protein n=1 Tax=Psychroserpens sp. SPM9 TaxID=2975598 RepID=UPI0021A9243E|nr:DUF4795 domain-containing protein [Psychroserpens sp. SPM9]MDG5492026.1 DUF4795 domain-containing protein [Psychroserpens sp. SPM9]